jgi:CspA family cold shock protein
MWECASVLQRDQVTTRIQAQSVTKHEQRKGKHMATGTVKFFNESKGFGFLRNSEGGSDIFVHISNIAGGQPLYQDDEVSFYVTETAKGLAAINVQMIRESQTA